jgi:hypothetical protein
MFSDEQIQEDVRFALQKSSEAAVLVQASRRQDGWELLAAYWQFSDDTSRAASEVGQLVLQRRRMGCLLDTVIEIDACAIVSGRVERQKEREQAVITGVGLWSRLIAMASQQG